MKSLPLTLSLAALLAAMPAMAQDNGSPPKPIKFEIGNQDADLALALVALDNGTIPFMGDWILANALVIVLDKQDDGSFQCFADLPMQCDADLWWQGVTYGAVDGLKIHPIKKVAEAADKAGAKPDADQGAAGEWQLVGQVVGVGNEPAPKKDGSPAQAPLPIELSFPPGENGSPGSVLQATLIGPTSDYNLVLVKVRVDAGNADAGGGTADVYLYRKVPGDGEGMLDVIEEHTVTADVSGAKTIRVFLATGTKSEPGVATAWRFLTTLAR
jgi:hypothetical protein